MNTYGLDFIELKNFDNIKYGKYHYNYKTVDFMLNWKENAQKTLIVFNARIGGAIQLPVFYKHDFENNDINVLCLSDKLLEYARNCHNTIYTGTTEIRFDAIYKEIIQNVLTIVNTGTNIFFGSCSGAHPAIRYGLLFEAFIVVTNGYVYIDEAIYNTYSTKLENQSNLVFINFTNIDTQKLIKIHKPKHLYIYINKNDTFVFNLNKEFFLECKKYFTDNISLIVHDTLEEGKDAHDIFYPKDQTFESIIKNIEF